MIPAPSLTQTCHCAAAVLITTPKHPGEIGIRVFVGLFPDIFNWEHHENQLLGSTLSREPHFCPADYWLGSAAQGRMEHGLKVVLQDC